VQGSIPVRSRSECNSTVVKLVVFLWLGLAPPLRIHSDKVPASNLGKRPLIKAQYFSSFPQSLQTDSS
jgi:hypothetical protein